MVDAAKDQEKKEIGGNAKSVHTIDQKDKQREEQMLLEDTVEDAIRQEIVNHRPKNIEKLDLIADTGLTYLNSFSGSGVVITNCKHYSHAKCLSHYCSQQRNANPQFQNRQAEGFGPSEFSCPICKAIGNCLMPELAADFPSALSSDADFHQLQT